MDAGSLSGGPSSVLSVASLPVFQPDSVPPLTLPNPNDSPATAVAVNAKDLCVELKWVESMLISGGATQGAVERKDVSLARAVEFSNVDRQHVYRAMFVARNTGSFAQRIRVSPPNTRAFQMHFAPCGPVAPGMEVPIEVSFRMPEAAASVADRFTDAIHCRAESGSVVAVPLRASVPKPELRYEPFISFGPVVRGTTVVRTLEISNSSKERGASVGISVKGGGLPVTVSPTRALLAPLGLGVDKPSKVNVRVTIDASHLQTGSYRSVVALEGPGVDNQVIDVSAEVVDHGVQIVYGDASGHLEQHVDFGTIFFGQKQTIRAVVINNGPQPVSFQLATGSSAVAAVHEYTNKGDGSSDGTSRSRSTGYAGGLVSGRTAPTGRGDGDESGGDGDVSAHAPSPTGTNDPVLDTAFDKDFRVAPTQGTLQPYQEMPITISFTATDRRPAPLFRAQAMGDAAEKQRVDAGLPPSPPQKLAGFGRYPNRRSPGRGGNGSSAAARASAGSVETLDLDSPRGSNNNQQDRSPRGKSMGATGGTSARGRKSIPAVSPRAGRANSASPARKTAPSMSAFEITSAYSRALPAVEVFTSRMALIVPELNQVYSYDLTGRGVRPSVSTSLGHVDFGTVAVNGRADAVLTIRNETELLPIDWHLEKCHNYYTEPQRGRLHPLAEARVTISFVPTKLGPGNEAMPLVIRPGNGMPMAPVSSLIIKGDSGEPIQRGAKNQKVATSAADPTKLLTIPIALTAIAVAPAPPMLPGSIPVIGPDGSVQASTGGLGVGLASQFGAPGPIVKHGGIMGGGVTIALGDEGGSLIPPNTVGPTGSIASTALTPYDGTASMSGTAAIAALSNATGPNAMGAVFRRSGMLAERHAGMPPHLLEPERSYVDQDDRAHTRTTAFAAAGHALIAAVVNAVEVAEERDRAEVRGSAPVHHRAQPWLEVATQRGLKEHEYPTEKRYTFNVQELHAKMEHTGRYNEFVTEQVDKRRRAKSLALLQKRGGALAKWDDPVSAGMEDGKLRLREPVLHVPDAAKEPLWLARPKGPDGRPLVRENGQGAAVHKLNPDKLVKTKYKPLPTTAAEKVDCSALLSDEELAAVVCGPPVINFGAVDVRETRQKSFGVFNGLPTQVLVQLHLPAGCAELMMTSPLSQVVPPNSTAGFDITFFAEEQQECRESISYIINGKHANRFSVSATALPIEVLLSSDDLQLKFSDDSTDPYVINTFRMSNPGKSDAEFMWSKRDQDAPFEIEPVSGVIAPGESASALVTYRPSYKCITETVLALAVRGGRRGDDAPRMILLGEEIDARASLSEQRLDFGRVGVGLRLTQTVQVKNTGSSTAVFYVSEQLPKYITVKPMIGRVDSMDTIELSVTIEAPKPLIIDPTQAGISITVRGAKGLYLPVAAMVVMPDIAVEETDINFGSVTLGTKARRRLTLVNRSPIHCEVTVDFSSQPRFEIRPPRRQQNMGGIEDDNVSLGEQSMFRFSEDGDQSPRGIEDDAANGSLASGLDHASFQLQQHQRSAANSRRSSSIGTGADDARAQDADGSSDSHDNSDDEDGEQLSDAEEEEDDDGGPRKLPLRFRVKMAPEQSLPFDLFLRPRKEGSIAFQLPVTVAGVDNLPGLQRMVTAVARKPRIKVESVLIDFEQRTWHRAPERRLPHVLHFKIYNTDSADVSWRADTTNLTPFFPEGAQQAFTFNPSSGSIPVGESLEVEVTFTPHAAKDFANTVPIILDPGADGVDSGGAPCLEMELRGKGVAPCITFDRRELILPPVPIGAVSSGVFYINNNGYDHCQLRFRVPSNEITTALNVPLRVTFPEGDTISISKTRLPVLVECKADKPMAFTSLVEFICADGGSSGPSPVIGGGGNSTIGEERFTIPVSGAADACVLTTYSYVDEYRGELYIEAPADKAPTLVSSARDGGAGGSVIGTAGASKAGTARGGKTGGYLGKPNAPHAPAFPSRETLNRAAAMVPAPTSSLPGLPIAAASTDSVMGPPVHPSGHPVSANGSIRSVPSTQSRSVHSQGSTGGSLSGPPVPASSHLNYAGLVQWLNACALRQPVHQWPQDVVKQNGKPILDMVEAFSGRQIPGRLKGSKIPQGKKDRAVALFRQAQEFLSFLKMSGGFVHSVRPESLLSREDFIFVRKYMSKGIFGPPYGAPERQLFKISERKRRDKKLQASYAGLSLHAWSTVSLQAIKIFALSRVTMRALAPTPGMHMDAESKVAWDALMKREADLAERIQAAKVATGAVRGGPSMAERPLVGPTVKPGLKGYGNSANAGSSSARSTSNGAMMTSRSNSVGVDPESSLMLELHGPKPSGMVEPSLTLSVAGDSQQQQRQPGAQLVVSPLQPASARSGASSHRDALEGAAAGQVITSARSTGSANFAPGSSAAALVASDAKPIDSALQADQSALRKAVAEFLSADAQLEGSNLYSIPELLLMRWLSYHHNRINITATRRIVDFGHDLSDGSVLVFLLLSHAPELGKPGRVLDLHSGNVHAQAMTPQQQRQNANAVVKALHELGLNPPFAPEDICPSAFATSVEDGEMNETELALMQAMGGGSVTGSQFTAPTSVSNTQTDAAVSMLEAQLGMLQASMGGGNANSSSSSGNTANVPAGKTGSVNQQASTLSLPGQQQATPKKVKPSQPLFTTIPTPDIPGRLPGTRRVKLGGSHARDMILWTLWLWTNLPQQVPRTTIDFKGGLNTKITKSVVLTNPTKKPIVYSVTIEGDPCFSAGGANGSGNASGLSSATGARTVKLEPNSTLSFPVTCEPRFSKPAHGKLVFFARRDGATAPSVLIFALRSVVIARPPIATKSVTTHLYQPVVVEVEVRNTSSRDGDFMLTLLHSDPNAKPGQNVSPAAIQSVLNASTGEFFIGADGALPLHLRPGYSRLTKDADDVAATLASMDKDALAMYGLTGDDAAALMSGTQSVVGGGSGVVASNGVVMRGMPNLPVPDGHTASVSASHTGSVVDGGDNASLTSSGRHDANAARSREAEALGHGTKHGLPSAFWCKHKHVHLKPGQSKKVPVQFLPFAVGPHRATIVLVDRHCEIAELIYEIQGTAEPPASHAQKLTTRAPLSKTIERLLFVPPINAHKENAYDATVDRADKRIRAQEVAHREQLRAEEASIRERALQGLRREALGRSGNQQKQSQKAALKSAASLILGTFYDVTIDSPFFEAPRRVYVPAPPQALPGSGAASAVQASSSPGAAGRRKRNSDGGIVPLTLPQLETPPGPIAAMPGMIGGSSVPELPPSQALDDIAPELVGQEYRSIISPAAVADALASGKEAMLMCLSRVPLICRPKGAGVYSTRVTLTSDKDVRCFDVEYICEAPLPIRNVTFNIPVGNSISQPLPVANNSSRDWNLSVALEPLRKPVPGHRSIVHFNCPDKLFVRAGQTATLPVTFTPEWMGDELVTLVLNEYNVTSSRSSKALTAGGASDAACELPVRIVFDLRGVAEEPLALDTIRFTAAVREEVTATVTVYNHSKAGPVTYQMETDVPHVAGAPTITVPPATDIPGQSNAVKPGVAMYTFIFKPTQVGQFLGQLMFTDQRTGRYQWYALEATAEPAEASARVAVSTAVRRAVAVDIQLSNPTDLEVALDVSLSGEGLVGEPVFVLGPGESRAYELLYAPLFPTPGSTNTDGSINKDAIPGEGSITFTAPSVGEVVYGLDLVAYPAEPVHLPPVAAPIGSSTTTYIHLDNPTATGATARGIVSNGRNFAIDMSALAAQGALTPQGLILIPAFSTRQVPVVYTPSALVERDASDSEREGQLEECMLVFESTQIGEWTFILAGTGQAPQATEPQLVLATIGTTVSAAVPFRNPFPFPLTIAASLELSPASQAAEQQYIASAVQNDSYAPPPQPALQLLKSGRNHSITLTAFGSTQLPFTFAPHVISECNASITVSGHMSTDAAAVERSNLRFNGGRRPSIAPGANLTWTFPIRAVGEAPVSKKAITLKATARAPATYPMALPLSGWTPSQASQTSTPASGQRKGSQTSQNAQPTQFTVELVPVVTHEDVASAAAGGASSSIAPSASIATGAIASRASVAAGGRRGSVIAASGALADGDEAAQAARAEALARLQKEIAAAVSIIARKTSLTAPGEPIEFDLQINATKPFHCRAEIVVSRSGGAGGAWRFPVRLSVAPAAPDDVLHLSSPLNTPGHLTFGLANAFPRSAPFRAYFSLDSAGEFRISPAVGVLPASTAALYGSDAVTHTDLTVTFTPREYGRRYTGTLIVETDDMMWSFACVGTLPHYKPPAVTQPVVDDRLGPAAMATLKASHSAGRHKHVVAQYLTQQLPVHDEAAGAMIPLHDQSGTRQAAGGAQQHQQQQQQPQHPQSSAVMMVPSIAAAVDGAVRSGGQLQRYSSGARGSVQQPSHRSSSSSVDNMSNQPPMSPVRMPAARK